MVGLLGAFLMLPQGNLAADIARCLDDSALRRAAVGVCIKELGGPILYETNSEKRLMPASTLKILTASFALDAMSTDFRPTTRIWREGETIYLIGGADACLSVAELVGLREKLHVMPGDRLVFDDQALGADRVNGSWEYGDMMVGDGPPVGALTVNFGEAEVRCAGGKVYLSPRNFGIAVKYKGADGELALRRDYGSWTLNVSGKIPEGSRHLGSVSLPDPGLCAARVVCSDARRGPIPAVPENAVQFAPRTLADLLQEMLENSNNHVAETVLRLAGAKTGKSGSWADSIALEETFLRKVGVDADAYRIADGCGLARFDELTPKLLVDVFEWELAQDQGAVFEGCLPKGGEGTLADRFEDLPVRAKTGTLTGVSCLAGVARPEGREPVVFAIMFCHYPGKAASVRAVQDEIVARICEPRGLGKRAA
jgi:D-alanyl-D-alanine carboxypeptidase/D-alanyl-D-alanine-endopeptidase (penicillin-binding protein 4)